MKITIIAQKKQQSPKKLDIKNRAKSSRLLPSTLTHFSKETNLYQGLYNGGKIDNHTHQSQPNEQKSRYRGNSSNLQNLIKQKSQSLYKSQHKPPANKSIEQFIQQNISLKKQLNSLKQQLTIIKSRNIVKNSNKLDIMGIKNVQIQFQKDIYWTNNQKALRVYGIRQQYDKLKKQFNQQNKQLKQVKRKLINNGLKQAQIYIQQLEAQNKKLLEKLKTNKSSEMPKQNKSRPLSTTHFRRFSAKKLSTHSQKQLPREQQQKQTQQKPSQFGIIPSIQELKNLLKQKDNKIAFLQKCLINKSNNQHAANCKVRKYKKQNQQFAQKYYQMKNQLQTCQKKLQIQRIKMKSYFNEQISSQSQKYKKQIHELSKKLQNLQKQYKNLEQRTSSKPKLNNSSLITKSLLNSNKKTNQRKASVDIRNLNILIRQQDQQSYALSRRINSQQHQQNSLNSSSSVQKQLDILSQFNDRQPCRANQKHSQNSIKLRKVQFNQIKYIGQLLKYKMIGLRIQPNHIKDYFLRQKIFTEQSDRSKSNNQILYELINQANKQQVQWQDEYITMKQTIKILNNIPFNLNHKQAQLLSRYLIQDCQQQYVYCDQKNQNKRQIVKSIIKSLIGQYNPTTQSQLTTIHSILQKYRANLKKMLQTSYPDGIISRNKLIQLLIGMGIQLNSRERDIIIGKLSVDADGLNQLVYLEIFQI